MKAEVEMDHVPRFFAEPAFEIAKADFSGSAVCGRTVDVGDAGKFMADQKRVADGNGIADQ